MSAGGVLRRRGWNKGGIAGPLTPHLSELSVVLDQSSCVCLPCVRSAASRIRIKLGVDFVDPMTNIPVECDAIVLSG